MTHWESVSKTLSIWLLLFLKCTVPATDSAMCFVFLNKFQQEYLDLMLARAPDSSRKK